MLGSIRGTSLPDDRLGAGGRRSTLVRLVGRRRVILQMAASQGARCSAVPADEDDSQQDALLCRAVPGRASAQLT